MPPTVRSGGELATAASYGILADQVIVDMDDRINYLEPNKTALTLLLSRLNRGRKATNPKFNHLEHRRIPDTTKVNNGAGYAAGATAIVVDDDTAQYAFPGAIIEVVRTGELMRCTAINTSTHTLTVTRSFGAVAAAQINDNDDLLVIAGAQEENSTSNDSQHVLKTKVTDYTQIFRGRPFGMSRTTRMTDMYGGDEEQSQKKEFGLYFAVEIEKAYLWGEATEDVSGNYPLRSTGGIHGYISTNVSDFSGTLSLAALDEAMIGPGQYAQSGVAVGLCSYTGFSKITQLGHSNIRITPATTSYGLRLGRLELSHRKVVLVPHKLFATPRPKTMYVLDMANLRERVMLDTKLLMDIQANDQDGVKMEYIRESGLQKSLEETQLRIDDLYT